MTDQPQMPPNTPDPQHTPVPPPAGQPGFGGQPPYGQQSAPQQPMSQSSAPGGFGDQQGFGGQPGYGQQQGSPFGGGQGGFGSYQAEAKSVLDGQHKMLAFGAMGAALVMLLGSIGTWATAKSEYVSISISGLEGGDGVLSLLVALAIGAGMGLCVFMPQTLKVQKIISFVAGGLAALVLLIALINLGTVSDARDVVGAQGTVSLGWGLILLLLASLAATGLCLFIGFTLGKKPANSFPGQGGFAGQQPGGFPGQQGPDQQPGGFPGQQGPGQQPGGFPGQQGPGQPGGF